MWTYVTTHAVDLAMLLVALVVLPLVSAYVHLRAMVTVGDWLDRKVREWRADGERW